ERVQAIGKPLKEWDIEIVRGIVTGFNEAFVINEATKKQLIKEDKTSAKLIKPLLRGRDLYRYGFSFQNLYLIGTFPSLNLKINDYPAIKKHLLSFGKNSLEQTGAKGARKKTSNDWFETQDQISYWKSFEQAKIIYPNMITDIGFAYDEACYYTNQKCFLITGEKLKYLVGVLNSKLFRFCYEDSFPEVQGNAREINKVIFIEKSVKYPSEKEETEIAKRVERILHQKKSGKETGNLEREIDAIVYQIHGFTFDESCLVEANNNWMNEEEYNKFSIEKSSKTNVAV
ncbi:MAG: hypothetical protein EOO46_20740, partial [Flavobacterium sp.]